MCDRRGQVHPESVQFLKKIRLNSIWSFKNGNKNSIANWIYSSRHWHILFDQKHEEVCESDSKYYHNRQTKNYRWIYPKINISTRKFHRVLKPIHPMPHISRQSPVFSALLRLLGQITGLLRVGQAAAEHQRLRQSCRAVQRVLEEAASRHQWTDRRY